jgi:tripartite-type tricarboxylate transporter receptor subunit TctC
VPYKGTVDGVADLLAERTHLMFAPMVTSLPHYRAGKVQVIGVTGSKRSGLMPAVPTFTESGYPKLDIPTWFALMGPAGLPGAAVGVISDAAAKALASKDVVDALANQAVEATYAGPAELDTFLKTENAMWRGLVNELGIKPQ